MNKRTTSLHIVVCACFLATLVLALAPAVLAQQSVAGLRPNLQALPASGLYIISSSTEGKLIRFSTTTWNSGDGPLELRAGETGSAGQNVYQRIFGDDGSFADYLAGTFEWHPQHNHFHFADYAIYTLQPVNAPGASERTGVKTTFCVMDTDKINGRLPGAPKQSVYSSCGATFQGMSVGWGDTYGAHLAGQSINIDGAPDGVYDLIIEVDPKKRIIEINDDDNTSCVRISITSFTVTTLGSCATSGGGGGQVTIASISPTSARAGSVTAVTILGTGFTSGISVGFEDGSGPRPTVSGVAVNADGTTITANVTIKNGKPGRDNVWDLRVGSTVLADAFTVAP